MNDLHKPGSIFLCICEIDLSVPGSYFDNSAGYVRVFLFMVTTGSQDLVVAVKSRHGSLSLATHFLRVGRTTDSRLLLPIYYI